MTAAADSTLEAKMRLMFVIVRRPGRFENALLAHRVRAIGELIPAVRFAERHITCAQTTPTIHALYLRGHGCGRFLRMRVADAGCGCWLLVLGPRWLRRWSHIGAIAAWSHIAIVLAVLCVCLLSLLGASQAHVSVRTCVKRLRALSYSHAFDSSIDSEQI